jgi:hypothetical protein
MYSQLQEGAGEPAAASDTAAPIGPPVSATGDGAPDEPSAASTKASLADDIAPAPVRRPSAVSSFKTEIARAMQVAADRERERIDAGVGEEETAQVEKIFNRAAAEAAELSKHADEDVNLVNAWYKDQVKRIRGEADHQIDERRARLEQSLRHHGSLIEAEIESVHVAVEDYRASLGAFIERLAEEGDPSAIARLAGDLPDPPDLDEVRADARSDAMQALEQETAAEPAEPTDGDPSSSNGSTGSEREPVPVMDPRADQQRAGVLSGTAVLVATSLPSDSSVSQPSTSPPPSEVEATALPAEPPSAHGSVAGRLIRAFTNRSAPTEAPEDR